MIEALLPAGIDPWGALALVVLSALTSGLTAAIGIGGGVILLAAMTFVVPVQALIPVHGVVQLGSNLGRAIVLLRDVTLRLILPFAVGGVLGAAVGASIVTDLPEAAILLVIGIFVTVTTWVRMPPLGRGERGIVFAGGGVSTVLTMFVGATGPFVMAMFRQAGLPHRSLVATMATAMGIQHTLKVAAFVLIGFSFGAWAPLMAAMIAAGFLGTLTGARLLSRLPERQLAAALRIVLTLIGLQLILRAVLALTGP